MESSKAKKRKAWVTIVILFWLAVGVAVPLIFNFSGDEIQFDNANVVAAPRDSFRITNTLLVDKQSGTTVSGGKLAMVLAKKNRLPTAETSAALLKSGKAVLLLDKSSLTLGAEIDGLIDGATQETQTAPLVAALKSGKYKALRLRDTTIIMALPNNHQERLMRANAQIVPLGDGAIEAKGDGYWRGQRSQFSLKTEPAADGKLKLKLSFKATLIEITYEGSFELGGERGVLGPASLHLKDTEKLANALGTSWPIGTSVQDIRIEGPLRWRGSILAFDSAKVSVRGNEALGTASLDTASGQALISSTLAFDELDIAPYLPSGQRDQTALAWQWWSKLVSTLSQPEASHINADIRLSTKRLSAGAHILGPAAATISMKNGKLSADVAEITIDSGRATGQVSVDFNRYIPKMTVRGQLEDVATGKWSEAMLGKRHLDGKGRIVADLASQGVSLEQIVGDLSGTIEFAMQDGGTVGISLSKSDLSQDGAAKSKDAVALALGGVTKMSGLEAACKVKDGVVSIVKASAAHSAGELKIAGRYDLMRQAFELRLLSLGEKADRKSQGDEGKASATDPKLTERSRDQEAMLISIASPKRDAGSGDRISVPKAGAGEIRLRTMTGSQEELERYMGPDYAKLPRRGL